MPRSVRSVRACREEFRYDSAVDYRADDFESALDAACPDSLDVYFDNTAGPTSDSVIRRLAVGARVVICGTTSIASWDPPPQGPRVERHLLVKRARIQGFLIFDHVQRSPEALRDLESSVRDGQIRYREDILDGIEQAPGSIAGLYRGENLGKRLIRIAPDVLPERPLPYANLSLDTRQSGHKRRTGPWPVARSSRDVAAHSAHPSAL